MPRVTREQMKKDEEKIIKILQTKANESIDTIAKQCGFSRQKAWRIIKRLEENNTIWGYHAIVDTEKLKMKTYILLIKGNIQTVKTISDSILKREAGKLAQKMGVTIECSSYIHGPYDWMITFSAKDTKHAKRFNHLVCKTYSEFIVDTALMEEMFPLQKCGFINPDTNKLKEFELFQ